MTSERYCSTDPWYSPWQPNASGSAVLAEMLLKLLRREKDIRLHEAPVRNLAAAIGTKSHIRSPFLSRHPAKGCGAVRDLPSLFYGDTPRFVNRRLRTAVPSPRRTNPAPAPCPAPEAARTSCRSPAASYPHTSSRSRPRSARRPVHPPRPQIQPDPEPAVRRRVARKGAEADHLREIRTSVRAGSQLQPSFCSVRPELPAFSAPDCRDGPSPCEADLHFADALARGRLGIPDLDAPRRPPSA